MKMEEQLKSVGIILITLIALTMSNFSTVFQELDGIDRILGLAGNLYFLILISIKLENLLYLKALSNIDNIRWINSGGFNGIADKINKVVLVLGIIIGIFAFIVHQYQILWSYCVMMSALNGNITYSKILLGNKMVIINGNRININRIKEVKFQSEKFLKIMISIDKSKDIIVILKNEKVNIEAIENLKTYLNTEREIIA